MRSVLVLLAPAVLSAQQVKSAKPLATHPAEWTSIAGVRELKDGRVVLLDERDQMVKLVDMKAGTASQIGRKGNGPGEYQLPMRLFALPGDSSAIWDLGNMARSMTITPSGNAGDLLPGEPETGFLFSDADVDGAGRLYRVWRASSAGTPIERLDRKTGRIDTVGYISRREECGGGRAGDGAAAAAKAGPVSKGGRGGGGPKPFLALEQWTVSSDGRVAIACPNPYQVLFLDSGRRLVGPVIPSTPVPVKDAEKSEWRKEQEQPVAVLSMTAGGGRTTGFRKRTVIEPDEWPDVKPAFVGMSGLHRAMFFDPAGMLWIERAVAAGAPVSYDVIGRDAKLSQRVTMPSRTRIVGFGTKGIYAVQIDDDDIQRLQLFPYPKR